jgi:hypothetical membrane protein
VKLARTLLSGRRAAEVTGRALGVLAYSAAVQRGRGDDGSRCRGFKPGYDLPSMGDLLTAMAESAVRPPATVVTGGRGRFSPTAAGARAVPWLGVVSSAASPVLLIAGWTIAGLLQPPSYSPVADTVSALAAMNANDRWVMTLVFLVVGVCDAVTGAALRPAASAGRLILITGAVAGMVVAANPEHSGGSVAHAVWASVGFAGLAAWPAGAWHRGPLVPWGLRPAVCAAAAAVQMILLAWFVVELITGAAQIGLAERVVGGAQAAWPLIVVLSCRSTRAGRFGQGIDMS